MVGHQPLLGVGVLVHEIMGMDLLVSWHFKPSQLQRITSGLKTNFSLSPSYSAHMP